MQGLIAVRDTTATLESRYEYYKQLSERSGGSRHEHVANGMPCTRTCVTTESIPASLAAGRASRRRL